MPGPTGTPSGASARLLMLALVAAAAAVQAHRYAASPAQKAHSGVTIAPSSSVGRAPTTTTRTCVPRAHRPLVIGTSAGPQFSTWDRWC